MSRQLSALCWVNQRLQTDCPVSMSDRRHRFSLRDMVAGGLREAGFAVETVRQYGEFPLLPKRVGLVARKPAGG